MLSKQPEIEEVNIKIFFMVNTMIYNYNTNHGNVIYLTFNFCA